PTCCSSSLFFFVARLLSGSPLFPYTTLFRSSEFRIVGEASGSREAIELVRRRRPKLLLVDYRLPDELGTVLVRRLRENGLDAPRSEEHTLNSSHEWISYAVFCLKKKTKNAK